MGQSRGPTQRVAQPCRAGPSPASPVLGSRRMHAASLAPVNLSGQLPKLRPHGQTLRRAEVGLTGIWELWALSALLGFTMF